MRKLSKKITSVALVVATIMAFYSPLSANRAEAASFLSSLGGSSLGTLIGCTGLADKVTGGIGKLFGKLGGKAGSAGGDSVPVADSKVGTETGSINKKETCLDSIAYSLSKAVLSKLTSSTLQWINTGFSGEPTFVKDYGSFYQSIANEQVSSYTARVGFDPTNYPFGRSVAQNIVRGMQRGNTPGSNLNNFLTPSNNTTSNEEADDTIITGNDLTYEQKFHNYSVDLLQGNGWNDFTGVTQLPGANPLSAYIQSVNNIGSQIALRKEETKQTTEQSSGFLDLKKCVDPSNYQPESADQSFTREQALAQAQNDPNDSDTGAAQNWLAQHTCNRFETQTPGIAIANQLNISLETSVRQLELADSLNESLSSVFDALSKQLFNKGVTSLSDSSSSSSNVQVFGGYGSNTSQDTTNNSSSSVANGDQWFNQNKDFDLLTALAPNGPPMNPDPACQLGSPNPSNYIEDPDCIRGGFQGQGLIVLTKVYTALLIEENRALADALKWTREMDMCVPGPRADWYQEALSNTQAELQYIDDKLGTITGNASDQGIQSLLDPGGLFSFWEDNKIRDLKRDFTYGEFLFFTGVELEKDVDDEDVDHEISLAQPVKNALMQVLQKTDNQHDGYRQKIDQLYKNNIDLANLNILNRQGYQKLGTYESTLESNTDEIVLLTTFIPRLTSIYNNLITAQTTYNINNSPTPENLAAYKRYYENQLRIFSSMVSDLKTDDDIQGALSDIERLKSEISYLADPISGLVRECINNLSLLPNNLVRRPYNADLVTPGDYLAQGWSPALLPSAGLPAFRGNTQQTFLMNYNISGHSSSSSDQFSIYFETYAHQCEDQGALSFNAFDASSDNCGEGLDTVNGGRYEDHINSY